MMNVYSVNLQKPSILGAGMIDVEIIGMKIIPKAIRRP
jgi:hypothetical protein